MRTKNGFVLPFVLVLMVSAVAVISGIAYFVTNAGRQTQIYLARSRCRFAAQTAIEQAKDQIWCQFFNEKIGNSSAATSVKIDPKSAQIYNEWFSKLELSDELTINECKVYLSASKKYVEFCEKNCSHNWGSDSHLNAGIRVLVPIFATAVYQCPNGKEVTITILEHVAFGTGQSEVFDYAYFVNNYGWMSGSTITINGDMRANGNVSLSQSTVNGFVYAAANDELGVAGTVSLKSTPRIKNQSAYRNAASSRARPDIGDYDTNKAYDAPVTSGEIRKPTYDSNGNITYAGTTAAASGESIIKEYSNSLPMPYISELSSYVEYARQEGGTLSYPSVTYTDSSDNEQIIPSGQISAHYEGAGPSGDASLADKGALVLVGTAANPIVINGPVVVDSDVIIKGYVKGQGTIYSGRNIHVVGDIKYVNPPSWGHTDDDDETVEENNSKKDMLGLMAKGNVVIGNYAEESSSSGGGYWGGGYSSSKTWYDTVASYINPNGGNSVVHSYACDESDANIGYPSTFDGNYTAVEKVSNLSAALADKAPGGYESSSGQFGKVRSKTVELDTYKEVTYRDWWGNVSTKKVYDTKTELYTSYDRKYYESVCDDAIVKNLIESRICQIDAVMYNNHGTFGTLGQNGYTVNINGSLICRDEALIFNGNLAFNWDMRLRSKTSKNMNTSLPPGPQSPFTYSWMQVADELNDAYVNRGQKKGDN